MCKKILRPVLLILLTSGIVRAQVKRLYLANDDHTDYMWTANEAAYDSAFVKMIDYYLFQIDSSKTNPPAFQSKYNLDGSFWIRAYQKYRSPAQFNRLIAAIRSGHISSPLNTLVSCYGAQPTEAVLRGMYYAGGLERKYNLRFHLAVSMENQTLPLGLSSLWAGAGARYSWRGVCGCATRFSNEALSHRPHQLYRYTGQDGQGVIMKWYARTRYNGRTLGGYAECRRQTRPKDAVADMALVADDLEKMCDTISQQSAYPFNVAAAFGYGWDDLSTFNAPDFIQAAQRYTNASRKVSVSNELDFFEDIARSYPRLPVERVSYGNEWDTYCASMNETTAKVRRATEQLRSAEALASVVALNGNDPGKSLERMRKSAWEAFGLYWEHDWTADGPVKQKDRADWQIRLQRRITDYVDTLQWLSRRTLSAQIPAGGKIRFYVFNPLSWSRTGPADLLYDGEPAKLVDLTNEKEVYTQPIQKEGKNFLRIQAKDIPSYGYKLYELRKGTPAAVEQTLTVEGEYISNKYFRIRVAPSGVITEWYDSLNNNRNLVKRTAGRYMNDMGTTDVNAGHLTLENAGPLSVTVRAVSADPLPHTVRVTVYANNPRIDIEDSIQANFSDLRTWAFSFNLNQPTTHHEELGAILTVKKETRGGDYAAQNGRYDWQTFNHFADLSEAKYGISISNIDCSFFTLGNSTPDSLWETSSQLKALAGGQTDPYTGLSIKVKDTVMMGIYRQNGETAFRYQFAVQSHRQAFDPVTDMKFALEHQNPLIAERVTGNSGAAAVNSFSLIAVSDPSVLVWGIKPSEDGIANGLITRLWNLNAAPSRTSLRLALPVRKSWRVSHIETDISSIPTAAGRISVPLNAYQITSYRLVTGASVK